MRVSRRRGARTPSGTWRAGSMAGDEVETFPVAAGATVKPPEPRERERFVLPTSVMTFLPGWVRVEEPADLGNGLCEFRFTILPPADEADTPHVVGE